MVEDRHKLAELYTADQQTWFPDGREDPNMTLIRFDVSDADYWDGHNNKARKALAYVTSIITGHPGRDGNTGVATLR